MTLRAVEQLVFATWTSPLWTSSSPGPRGGAQEAACAIGAAPKATPATAARLTSAAVAMTASFMRRDRISPAASAAIRSRTQRDSQDWGMTSLRFIGCRHLNPLVCADTHGLVAVHVAKIGVRFET